MHNTLPAEYQANINRGPGGIKRFPKAACAENNPGVLKAKLMIVDDVPMVREILRRTVEKNGYEVVGEAADGRAAVLMAGETAPDLVIMDISMEVMDGISASREIKRIHPDIKIIILSSHIMPHEIMESARFGVDNFLHKPFESVHLIRVLEKALSQ